MEDQIDAFRDDINAVCVRYLNEFDIPVWDMVLCLAAQAMMITEEIDNLELGNNEEWHSSTT